MNTLTIIYTNGKTEEIHRSNLTPTGLEMRNTSPEQLRSVLHGDGRRLLVYAGDGTRIIMPDEVRDIIINGESVFIEKGCGHNCGVWCDKC
jgi:hypothetical protein